VRAADLALARHRAGMGVEPGDPPSTAGLTSAVRQADNRDGIALLQRGPAPSQSDLPLDEGIMLTTTPPSRARPWGVDFSFRSTSAGTAIEHAVVSRGASPDHRATGGDDRDAIRDARAHSWALSPQT
jgi:hypothetical protein